ncbi:AAEL002630-PA [Aedes aegypti]|uniref:AAEL002630-PA n=1 Tax=Aedes aegypti TaxID=7159 RepID=Q17HR6_AEDAE|nr:AAEL002630-PA [Aedes aegypti]
MNNIGFVQKCPDDLYFNAETEFCDLPANVDCESPSTTTEPGPLTTDSTEENETTELTTSETDTTTFEPGTTDGTDSTSTSGETSTDETDSTAEDITTTSTHETDSTTEDITTISTHETNSTVEDITTISTDETDSTVEDITSTPTDETDSTVGEVSTTEETTEQYCEPLCAGQESEVAHPDDCGMYISCVDKCDGAITFCPPGLHFNYHWSVCDLPQRAECLLEICNEQTTEYVASVNSCRSYYNCTNSNATLHSCEIGYIFDSSSMNCVPEGEHNKCEVEDIPSAPQEVYQLCTKIVADQLIPHPSRCDVFYRCVRGMLSPRMCLEGLLFDSTFGACNIEEEVECNA